MIPDHLTFEERQQEKRIAGILDSMVTPTVEDAVELSEIGWNR